MRKARGRYRRSVLAAGARENRVVKDAAAADRVRGLPRDGSPAPSRHDAQFWRVLRAKYANSVNREKELLGYWMRMQRLSQCGETRPDM
jgi:hypothetical protein